MATTPTPLRRSPRAPASLALLLLLRLATLPAALSAKYTDCAVDDYYPPSLYLYDPAEVAAHLRSTHRDVIPYTSTASDVWDALITLDSDESGTLVRLIYSDEFISSTPYGVVDTWNREHMWPKSLGVGYDGPDFTDLHALRPADWNVNAARSNRHFGACGISEPASECVSPAHPEAAADTERDSYTFLPPADRRGDVARAALYMSARYDGTDPGTEDLTLTDCPGDGAAMGYLSQLLKWHEDDPVDESERLRNDALCSDWQGNRNPYVDFPHLVPYHFGMPRPDPPPDGSGYDCSVPNPSGPAPPPPPPPPTPGPTSPPGPSHVTRGTCGGLTSGDVVPVGFRSDNPDAVVLAALSDVPAGAELFLTDNEWTAGGGFAGNEGVKLLVAPAEGIPSGMIFAYGDATLPLSASWKSVSGTFALSATSDEFFLYCLDDDATGNPVPYTLFALTYAPNGWSYALPADLPSYAVITLPHMDNYRYEGPRSGTKLELLASLSDPASWAGSSSVSFDPSPDRSALLVQPPPTPAPVDDLGTCGGLVPGDVMIAGFDADDPDSVALAALGEVPAGAALFLTDNAWTGTEFKSSEGVKKLTVPPGGIARGTVFGYGDGFSLYRWEAVGGSLRLSSESDALFVYCIGVDGVAPVHLSGVSYSTEGWVPPDADGDAFSSGVSALPDTLPADCSVELGHMDNYVYVGSREGTKGDLLAAMSDPARWSGSDVNRYDLPVMLGEFKVTP